MKKIINELKDKLKKDVQSWDYKNGINDYYSVLFDHAETNDQLINELVEKLDWSLKENMCYSKYQRCIIENKCVINFDIKQCDYIKAILLIERAKGVVG